MALVGKHELLHTDSCLWWNGRLWTLHFAGEESGTAGPLYSNVELGWGSGHSGLEIGGGWPPSNRINSGLSADCEQSLGQSLCPSCSGASLLYGITFLLPLLLALPLLLLTLATVLLSASPFIPLHDSARLASPGQQLSSRETC